MKMLWKCLDYSLQEIKKATDEELKAMMLNDWANCRLEHPPKEFGQFSTDIVVEMTKRGIDPNPFIG